MTRRRAIGPWALLAATVVATVVLTPLALVLALAGLLWTRRTGGPGALAAAFAALAALNLVLLVAVGLSLTVSSGGESSSSG